MVFAAVVEHALVYALQVLSVSNPTSRICPFAMLLCVQTVVCVIRFVREVGMKLKNGQQKTAMQKQLCCPKKDRLAITILDMLVIWKYEKTLPQEE